MKSVRKQHGFTLVEILVTLTLVSILLAIAVPQYNQYIARGQVGEAMTIARGLQDEIIDIFSVTETLPVTLAEVTTLPATAYAGRYTTQVTLDQGAIVATMGDQARASLLGATLVFRAYRNLAGDLFFFCDTATAPAALTRLDTTIVATTVPVEALPADCRT